MTTIEEFTSQYGLVKKIDAFRFMKYLHDNPDAPRKIGRASCRERVCQYV